MILNKYRIEHGVNDYATVIEPTENDNEQLTKDGYVRFSSFTIKDETSEHYGKYAELWIK